MKEAFSQMDWDFGEAYHQGVTAGALGHIVTSDQSLALPFRQFHPQAEVNYLQA